MSLAAPRNCKVAVCQRQSCRQSDSTIDLRHFISFTINSFAKHFTSRWLFAINILCLYRRYCYLHNKLYTFLIFISWIIYNYNMLTSNCVVLKEKKKTCCTSRIVTDVMLFLTLPAALFIFRTFFKKAFSTPAILLTYFEAPPPSPPHLGGPPWLSPREYYKTVVRCGRKPKMFTIFFQRAAHS